MGTYAAQSDKVVGISRFLVRGNGTIGIRTPILPLSAEIRVRKVSRICERECQGVTYKGLARVRVVRVSCSGAVIRDEVCSWSCGGF